MPPLRQAPLPGGVPRAISGSKDRATLAFLVSLSMDGGLEPEEYYILCLSTEVGESLTACQAAVQVDANHYLAHKPALSRLARLSRARKC